MKLINRKTNEMAYFGDGIIDLRKLGCENVAEMIEAGWEDYEEPEDYWYIDWTPNIGVYYTTYNGTDCDNRLKEIGNYFETKEEAEKAVEKLKAWKRLKDNGLEIKGWKFTPDMRHTKGNFVEVGAEIPYIVDNKADLDLLFGGEE